MEPVSIKRVFPCGKRQLFDAWSRPALMMKWFFASQQAASSTVSNSFTVGGHYTLVMHLPGGDYRHHGEYRAIRRYTHIAFSWNSHLVRDSLVELDFRELSPNRTELTLRHTLFPDEATRGKHLGGWERCLANLERFFDAGVEGME